MRKGAPQSSPGRSPSGRRKQGSLRRPRNSSSGGATTDSSERDPLTPPQSRISSTATVSGTESTARPLSAVAGTTVTPPPSTTRDSATPVSLKPARRHEEPNLDERVHVAIRVRPAVIATRPLDASQSATFDDDGDEAWSADPLINRVQLKPEWTKNNQEVEYHFDKVFIGSDNAIVYEESVRDFIRSSMEGYNATVFAMGQTGSGKTYTMMGSTSQAGMVPQTVEDVFAYIREASVGREFLLRVSYMEIYNETIRDLLAPDVTDLRIHEDKTRGVYVSPLKEEIVTTAKQVMKIIQKGEAIRHVSETDYNLHSSRSHTIFQMVIESRDRLHSTSGSPNISRRYVNPSVKGQGPVRVSQLNLIDLAGSEKASSSAERRKEGAFINKSLLTLGTVISKLTEPNSGHIPFRDSKLTRILQTSLSGNARVSVICAINPSVGNIEESHNTLKFATRLKKVSTKAQPNQVLDDKALLQKYKVEITELKTKLIRMNAHVDRQEVEALKREKAKYEEDRMEMELVRTALKERIDHLTKLILTSSTIASKPILDWSETGSRRALPADGGPVARQQEQLLRTELAEKDEIIARLQRQLDGKEKYSETLRSLLEDEKAPESPTTHTGEASSPGSAEGASPTEVEDVQARYVRGELQQLRRTNNELRQQQQEQEAKIRSLRAQLEAEKSRRGADADHSAARRERDQMAGTLEEQRIVILELENECDELRDTVAQLRNSLAQLQMTRFEIDEASVSAVRPSSSDSLASGAPTSVSATSIIAQPSALSSSSATEAVVHLKDMMQERGQARSGTDQKGETAPLRQ